MSAGIWVIHTGAKSGCKRVTLFDSDCYDIVSAGIWVIHTVAKTASWRKAMNPGSSTLMVDLVWDINSQVIMYDRPGALAKPLCHLGQEKKLCQSHVQVFPTLMRLWPLLIILRKSASTSGHI